MCSEQYLFSGFAFLGFRTQSIFARCRLFSFQDVWLCTSSSLRRHDLQVNANECQHLQCEVARLLSGSPRNCHQKRIVVWQSIDGSNHFHGITAVARDEQASDRSNFWGLQSRSRSFSKIGLDSAFRSTCCFWIADPIHYDKLVVVWYQKTRGSKGQKQIEYY